MIKHRYPTPFSDREWLAEHLRQNNKTPIDAPRGDHDLNPGTRNTSPLTRAAVLIPLVIHVDRTSVLLTRRTKHLAKHPGQISFPGGQMEDMDGTPEETALRETEEEIGFEFTDYTLLKDKNNNYFRFECGRGLIMYLAKIKKDHIGNAKLKRNPKTDILEHFGYHWAPYQERVNNLPRYLQKSLDWAHYILTNK